MAVVQSEAFYFKKGKNTIEKKITSHPISKFKEKISGYLSMN